MNSGTKLKAQTPRTEPRRGAFRAKPSGAPKEVPKGAPPKPTKGPLRIAGYDSSISYFVASETDAGQSQKTTMEEVDDEDADGGAGTGAAKKKKKKKNNKKKKAAGEEGATGSPVIAPASPAAKSPTSPGAAASTSNFHIPVGTTEAQSGHSYLKELGGDQKSKVKTRADHASIFSNQSNQTTEQKGGWASKLNPFGSKTGENKNAKYTWFSRLSKKATDSMHQILRTGEDAGKQPSPMKWDTFVKLMREMGFEYDPSTAGSSVRFDPPNSKDHPISIHKPHPDSTLTPIMLIKIGKRLKRRYGWNEEDFIKQTTEATAAEGR